VGAGCSQSAGVPTASELIVKIRTLFPNEWEAAGSPEDYSGCMKIVDDPYRRTLIEEAVRNAKLNPAHLAIGQLLKAGFIDRVLTTNFDPLILKACALVDADVAVYDYPALSHMAFSRNKVSFPAVFYLHGQHTGVIQLNTASQFDKHGAALTPLIKDTNEDCVWIVVGYSGESDPTVDQLGQLPDFESRLYWVAYNQNMPCAKVTSTVLARDSAFLVRGFDADRFFVRLARELDCFPPDVLASPFTALGSRVNQIQMPEAWDHWAAGMERETARDLDRAKERIGKIQKLVEGSAEENAESSALAAPVPHPGLIVNLSRFGQREEFHLARDLIATREAPGFRTRVLTTNWGPLLVAVEYHADVLRHCWLVCTPQARSDFEHAQTLIGEIAPNCVCHAVDLDNPHSIFAVQRTIREIYDGLDEAMPAAQVIADITGGLSSMTSGMVLATLDEDRAIEYLRQDKPLVTGGVALTREQIREQQILVGIWTSGSMVRETVVREALR
jgi:hypothetical protein